MSALEHELVEKISRLSVDQQQEVLEFVRGLEKPSQVVYSARELMKLSTAERQRYMQAAFDLAADEDFETFEA
ncbi:MAG TPA: hypothetical protein VHD90_17910 [Phototrophicaceae bacterium]|nr:hypothetical protein [Phototrophicaceae bacterium]